jgi:hypothetical protein
MNTAFERTEQKDEWLTPPHIFRSLGKIDLDPCAPIDAPWYIATRNITILGDGLKTAWDKDDFVFCNPPYGRQTHIWLKKMKSHNNGIALIFARTDTKMFHDYVFTADAILYLKGRLRFCDITGKPADSAGAPSCLVAYGPEAVARLLNCGLEGKLIILRR